MFQFERSKATEADVLNHLLCCDATYSPPLSSRVDLHTYAAKLITHAKTFEAWQNGTLQGLVAAYINAQDKAYITDVSINPLCRGQGIATHLLQDCIADAIKNGCRFIDLEVNVSNTNAIKVYMKLGFQTCNQDSNTQKMRLILNGAAQ
jgi:ribosomal-protein-alanine N-acetyltransferase